MGKIIAQSNAEIDKCATLCQYFAKETGSLLQAKIIKTNYESSYVTYRPLGIVFAIEPWNFPLWQVFRFAVPNLMAGNAAILKHAPISTGTALAIEAIFKEASFPDNLFKTVIVDNEVAEKIIAHPKIAGVTLTGSDHTGRIIAKNAGENLKKVVLELGGNDAYVILKDADLEQAASTCVNTRMFVSGQVCISPKRLIVEEAIWDDFQQLVLEKTKAFSFGDPMQESSKIGPLAREDLRDTVDQQVRKSIANGAKLLLGGKIPEGPGFYYPPTLLTNVKKGQAAFDEEIFGPVVALIKAKDEDDAIALANDSPYGLGAAVFTKDIKKGEEIAATKLRAGTCCVNTNVSSDQRLPFGGIKNSGFGRELAPPGIYEFLNVKTVCIK